VVRVDPIGLLILLIIIVGVILFFARVKDPSRRARFLKRTGMTVMGLFGGFLGLFIVGETLTDPGGWKGMGLITIWLVPLAALAAIAWLKPTWGVPILAVLTAAAVALTAWRAFDERIRDLEDRIGPFTTVVIFAVAVATTALGHERTRTAGIMLLAIGAAPFLFWGLVDAGDGLSLGTVYMVVGSPMVVAGTLYVLSDVVARRARPPGTEEPGPYRLAA